MHTHFSRVRMEQGQQLGRSIAEVFMRLLCRIPFRLPTRARLGHRLERTCFVLAPDIQTQLHAQRISVLNQLFLGWVSGSVTETVPALRLRKTVPVWHQVRFS